MNKRIALVLSVLTLSLLPATSVKAESGQMHIFEPCSMSPVAPCIESLSVVDELGKSHI